MSTEIEKGKSVRGTYFSFEQCKNESSKKHALNKRKQHLLFKRECFE